MTPYVSFARGVFSLALSVSAMMSLHVHAETVGGGDFYPHIISSTDATMVSNKTQLLDALAAAQSGDVIYIQDDAIIDLSGTWRIAIPSGVTLASGRGKPGSEGALLLTGSEKYDYLFSLYNVSDVRITGLRFKGPYSGIDDERCGGNDAQGVRIRASSNIRLDNNQFYAWPNAGISVKSSQSVDVSYNHFHHNRRKERTPGCRYYGLGYGVAADTSTDVRISYNLFHHNRHDIASAGSISSETEYEASYNLVLDGGISHSFDVHGGDDRESRDDHNAGHRFWFHHNRFYYPDHEAIKIRGIPLVGAWIWDNQFIHANQQTAIEQRYATGNMFVEPNTYQIDKLNAVYASLGGSDYWHYRKFESSSLAQLKWGDFDGDGRQDAFKSDGSHWWISRGAKQAWEVWGTSQIASENLGFADFNGDGQTDVFRSHKGIWWVSYSGKSKWQQLGVSNVALPDLRFGDFNGDGKDDILRANKGEWKVSWSGTSRWEILNTEKDALSDILFGDFNGDGKTDLFKADGKTWWVCLSAKGEWLPWGNSKNLISSLKVGDFNGDGKSDIFKANGGHWYVSYAGQNRWQQIGTSNITDVKILDINGDKRSDVIAIF